MNDYIIQCHISPVASVHATLHCYGYALQLARLIASIFSNISGYLAKSVKSTHGLATYIPTVLGYGIN